MAAPPSGLLDRRERQAATDCRIRRDMASALVLPHRDPSDGNVRVKLANITFDCDDVLRVASFWSAALDRPLDPGSGGYSRRSVDATRTGPNRPGTSGARL